eukprot:g3656.t1
MAITNITGIYRAQIALLFLNEKKENSNNSNPLADILGVATIESELKKLGQQSSFRQLLHSNPIPSFGFSFDLVDGWAHKNAKVIDIGQICHSIATKTQEAVESKIRRAHDFWYNGMAMQRGRATLLVLDRSVDYTAPMLIAHRAGEAVAELVDSSGVDCPRECDVIHCHNEWSNVRELRLETACERLKRKREMEQRTKNGKITKILLSVVRSCNKINGGPQLRSTLERLQRILTSSIRDKYLPNGEVRNEDCSQRVLVDELCGLYIDNTRLSIDSAQNIDFLVSIIQRTLGLYALYYPEQVKDDAWTRETISVMLSDLDCDSSIINRCISGLQPILNLLNIQDMLRISQSEQATRHARQRKEQLEKRLNLAASRGRSQSKSGDNLWEACGGLCAVVAAQIHSLENSQSTVVLSTEDYPYVVAPPPPLPPIPGMPSVDDMQATLIVVIVGGITFNEARRLRQLAKRFPKTRLVVVTTGMLTFPEYFEMLDDLYG